MSIDFTERSDEETDGSGRDDTSCGDAGRVDSSRSDEPTNRTQTNDASWERDLYELSHRIDDIHRRQCDRAVTTLDVDADQRAVLEAVATRVAVRTAALPLTCAAEDEQFRERVLQHYRQP